MFQRSIVLVLLVSVVCCTQAVDVGGLLGGLTNLLDLSAVERFVMNTKDAVDSLLGGLTSTTGKLLNDLLGAVGTTEASLLAELKKLTDGALKEVLALVNGLLKGSSVVGRKTGSQEASQKLQDLAREIEQQTRQTIQQINSRTSEIQARKSG